MRGLGTWLFGALESEQDRWFLWLPVLFGAGIALYFALPTEPSLIRATAAVTMALIVRVVWRHGPMSLLVGSALMAVVLGFAVGKLRSDWVAAPVLTAQIGPVEVRGWVELLEPRPAGGHRLTLLVAGIERLQAHERPARVRIRVSEGGSGLKPGDAISVRAMLSGPAGPALPGGYDFARSAWFQGLGGVGFALAPPVADPRLGEAPTALRARAAIERLRQAIGARVTTALPGNAGAIANALITGERGGISEATNQAFRDSGLLHILSISGLHMAIMAGAVFLSVRFLLALVPALALRFPIKKWAAAAATLGALGYLLISGASFPTVRSWIMISIMFLAVMLERPALALRNVALAALAILVLFPESLMDVSFQMSFAAVVALVAAYEIVRDRAQDGGGGRRGPWLAVLPVLRRHRAVDAGCQSRRGPVRRVPFSQEPAICGAGEPDCHSHLQCFGHASSARHADCSPARSRVGSAPDHGLGDRGHDVVRPGRRGSAGRGGGHSRHSNGGLRTDALWRLVDRTLAHAMAAHWPMPDCFGVSGGAAARGT